MINFSLSPKGLFYARQMSMQNDFEFIIGDHKYPCSKFFAGFLSPKVADLYKMDSTINSYTINVCDNCNQFNKIIELAYGQNIISNENESEYYIQIGEALGNEEIVNHGILLKNQCKPLDNSNVLSRLKTKRDYGLSSNEEIGYVAEHFSELNRDEIMRLDVEAIEEVLNNPRLSIDSESQIFAFVTECIRKNGNSYRELFSTIHFELLPQSDMEKFIKMVTIIDLTPPMWQSLCARLLMGSDTGMQTTRKPLSNIEIHPGENLMHGIIYEISKKCGGNVHTKGEIEITASSSEYGDVHKIADSNWGDYWYSHNEDNGWVRFDFKERRIKPDSYVIKSMPCGPGFSHMKSWVLEGSNNCSSWSLLDAQTNNNDLNKKRATVLFGCKNDTNYKYLRLRMTGLNHFNSRYMCLAGIEFYGSLQE